MSLLRAAKHACRRDTCAAAHAQRKSPGYYTVAAICHAELYAIIAHVVRRERAASALSPAPLYLPGILRHIERTTIYHM